MTLPHRYVKNQFVRISRGTLNNLPLLVATADGSFQAELRYIFARDAKMFNIRILALNIEPFGYVAIIFDPEMRRSEFLKSVNQSISLVVKSRIEHRESLWANKKPGNVPILDLQTLKVEIVNVCVTPVRDGYVRSVEDWELPTISPADWGTETECPHPKYPDIFIANECPGLESPKDEKTDLIVNSPTDVDIFSNKIPEFVHKVIALKDELITQIDTFERAERKRRKRVLGIKSCRIRKRFLNVKYQKPWKYMDHRKTVLCACANRAKKIKNVMKKFYIEYNACLVSFIVYDTRIFPAGTLKMRTLFRAKCKTPDDDDLFHFTV